MNTVFNREKECETQKLINFLLNSRTVLYSLEPEGIGTPYLESFTSYISRLSIKHNVTLGTLLEEKVAPIVNSNSLKNYLSKDKSYNDSYRINGISKTGTELIPAIEELTGREDIHNMTLNNWTGILNKNVMAHHRKWCPVCLNQFMSESKEVYEPLIWYISDIYKCDLHEIRLDEKCPSCGKILFVLNSRLMVGYCQFCHAWLGSSSKIINREPLNKKESFLLHNYKQLIENGPSLTSFPTKDKLSSILFNIKEELNLKSISMLSKLLDVKYISLYYWMTNNTLPMRKSMFQIALKSNSTIFELVIEVKFNLKFDKGYSPTKLKKTFSLVELENGLKEALYYETPKSLSKVCSEIGFSARAANRNFPSLCTVIKKNFKSYQNQIYMREKMKLDRVLNEALAQKIPITLAECLRKCGIPYSTAKKKSPKLCEEVSNRYEEYKNKLSKEKMETIQIGIEKIIVDLHQRDIYPSRIRIEAALASPGLFIDKRYKKWRKEIMDTLGINIKK